MASSSCGGFTLLLVAVFSVSSIIVPGALAGGCSCPPLWTAFGDNCYRFFAAKNVTWLDAEMACRGFSVPCGEAGSSDVVLGHLTSVHSREEMDFVSVLVDSVRNKWVPDGAVMVWIGLNDRDSESDFMWSDGTAANFTYWAYGQPATNPAPAAGQDCVMLKHTNGFKWFDMACGWALPDSFVCKMPKW